MAKRKKNKSILVKWLVGAISLYILSYVMESISITGFIGALWAAALLGIVNIIVKPILLFFTLPITLLTLGLFTFVINGIMLLVVSNVSSSLQIEGIGAAIIGSLLLSIINSILLSIVD